MHIAACIIRLVTKNEYQDEYQESKVHDVLGSQIIRRCNSRLFAKQPLKLYVLRILQNVQMATVSLVFYHPLDTLLADGYCDSSP